MSLVLIGLFPLHNKKDRELIVCYFVRPEISDIIHKLLVVLYVIGYMAVCTAMNYYFGVWLAFSVALVAIIICNYRYALWFEVIYIVVLPPIFSTSGLLFSLILIIKHNFLCYLLGKPNNHYQY
jgi:hypothetical protein